MRRERKKHSRDLHAYPERLHALPAISTGEIRPKRSLSEPPANINPHLAMMHKPKIIRLHGISQTALVPEFLSQSSKEFSDRPVISMERKLRTRFRGKGLFAVFWS